MLEITAAAGHVTPLTDLPPGKIRVFADAELAAAKSWISPPG